MHGSSFIAQTIRYMNLVFVADNQCFQRFFKLPLFMPRVLEITVLHWGVQLHISAPAHS